MQNPNLRREPTKPIVENRKVVIERDSLQDCIHEIAEDVNWIRVRNAGFRTGDRLHITIVVRLDEEPPVDSKIAIIQKIG